MTFVKISDVMIDVYRGAIHIGCIAAGGARRDPVFIPNFAMQFTAYELADIAQEVTDMQFPIIERDPRR